MTYLEFGLAVVGFIVVICWVSLPVIWLVWRVGR